jgi:hypothetical protein
MHPCLRGWLKLCEHSKQAVLALELCRYFCTFRKLPVVKIRTQAGPRLEAACNWMIMTDSTPWAVGAYKRVCKLSHQLRHDCLGTLSLAGQHLAPYTNTATTMPTDCLPAPTSLVCPLDKTQVVHSEVSYLLSYLSQNPHKVVELRHNQADNPKPQECCHVSSSNHTTSHKIEHTTASKRTVLC